MNGIIDVRYSCNYKFLLGMILCIIKLNSLVTEICKCNQELETSTVKGDKYYTVSFNVYYIKSRV